MKDIVEQDHPDYAYVARIENEIDRITTIVRKMFDLYHPEETETREVSAERPGYVFR